MPILKKILHSFSNLFNSEKNSVFKQDSWQSSYDAAVPHQFIAPNETLLDLLEQAVHDRPDKAFLHYFGKKITYREFYEFIQKAAFSYRKMGVNKNDRIAILLPNTPDFLISYWAALYIGAIAVPISPFLSSSEIKTCLKIANPKVFVVLNQLVPRAKKGIEKSQIKYVVISSVSLFMPNIKKIVASVTLGFKRQQLSTTIVPFRHIIHAPNFWEKYKHASQDNAVMLFTGGTTGTPKAVLYTHKNLVANAYQSRLWIHNFQDGHENILAVLPFCHSYGMTSSHHLAVLTQSTIILEPRFNAQRVIYLIKKYSITFFPGVPTMYKAVIDRLVQKGNVLSSVQVCISGGAPLPVKIKQEFEALTGSTLVEGYGLTEASPITHCNPISNKNKTGSIGLPLPGTEVKILNADGKPVDFNESGDMYVRGPQVMKAYWNAETETRQVLADDGWLATGDIARMDEDGYFYIVDRKKDLIISGGFNIYPSEVESIIHQHEAVDECAVVGVPDDFYGEIVKAFIIKKPGKSLSAKQVQQFCRNKLAAYKLPKQIEFVDKLPKNFLGKVLRRQLIKYQGQSK